MPKADYPSRRPVKRDIERLIGQQLRAARRTKGLSQATLGKTIGVTYQQMQKYETGTNRLSASTLRILAQVLEQPLQFFLGDEIDGHKPVDLKWIDLAIRFSKLNSRDRDMVAKMMRSMGAANV